MALISLDKFNGSIISNEVMESLNYCNLTTYLASFGYQVTIDPNMPETPDGLIEDCPDSHTINFVRRKVCEDRDDGEIISQNQPDDFKFLFIFGFDTKSENTVIRKDNITWYKHSHSVTVNRHPSEDISDYCMRISLLTVLLCKIDLGGIDSGCITSGSY